ncbi:unnamed protein product [Choristocarpus tenellus]
MSRYEDSRAILSSLHLQVLLYFNGWFSSFFCGFAICTYVYKSWRYYYPSGTLEMEVSFIFLFAVVEHCRLFLATKGNKTEQINPLLMSLSLAVPVIILYVYCLALQVYVLRLDVILSVIGIVFVTCEGILSLGTAVSFYNSFRG